MNSAETSRLEKLWTKAVSVNYSDPPYDPFGERGPTHYLPTNEAAWRTHAWWLITLDLSELCDIFESLKSPRQKKLILKSIMTALLAMDGHIRRLVALIMKDFKSQKKYPLDTFKDLSRSYRRAFDRKASEFTFVRNTISSHVGEDKSWVELQDLEKAWNLLDIDGLNEIFAAQLLLFNCMRTFPIATWIKRGSNGEIALIQPNPLNGATFTVVPGTPDDFTKPGK